MRKYFALTAVVAFQIVTVLPAASQETCRTVRDCTEEILKKVTALHEENKVLAQALNELRAQLPPKGSIVALEEETCPTGWSVYVRGRGRFLLGVGGEGAGLVAVENAGTHGGAPSVVLSEANLPSHQHQTMAGVGAGSGGFGDGPLGPTIFGASMGHAFRSLTSPVGSSAAVSIIPPYVALLLCRKD